MPEKDTECLADRALFGEEALGSTVWLSEDNDEEDLEHFAYREYEIVGLVQSPLYLQYERGNTSIGTGRLDGYLYLMPGGFDVDYYTEIDVKFERDFELYSTEYSDYIGDKEALWEELTREAFWGAMDHPTCDGEHLIVHKLRGLPCFVPELDFVAEVDGKS